MNFIRLSFLILLTVSPAKGLADAKFEPWGPSREIFVSDLQVSHISGPYEQKNDQTLLNLMEDGEVILTFDDGPYTNPFSSPGSRHYNQPTTQMVLAQLHRENVQAVFFVQGSHTVNIKNNSPKWKKRLFPAPVESEDGSIFISLDKDSAHKGYEYVSGEWQFSHLNAPGDGQAIYPLENPYASHTLAAHTLRHERIDHFSGKALEKEILGSVQIIEEQWGRQTPFFRFPFGLDSPEANKLIKDNSLIAVSWEIDSEDTAHNSREKILEHILSQLKKKKKGVLLFHDTRRVTATHLGWFIQNLKQQGFRPAVLR